jgi:hypothetical protein
MPRINDRAGRREQVLRAAERRWKREVMSTMRLALLVDADEAATSAARWRRLTAAAPS